MWPFKRRSASAQQNDDDASPEEIREQRLRYCKSLYRKGYWGIGTGAISVACAAIFQETYFILPAVLAAGLGGAVWGAGRLIEKYLIDR